MIRKNRRRKGKGNEEEESWNEEGERREETAHVLTWEVGARPCARHCRVWKSPETSLLCVEMWVYFSLLQSWLVWLPSLRIRVIHQFLKIRIIFSWNYVSPNLFCAFFQKLLLDSWLASLILFSMSLLLPEIVPGSLPSSVAFWPIFLEYFLVKLCLIHYLTYVL